jgi:hypothetical protein
MLEIEELPRNDNEDGSDSGIELIYGEFEEPPENYGEEQENDNNDSTSEYCSDYDGDEQELLHGLQRLRYDPGAFKKRTYSESIDGGSDCEGGSVQGDTIDINDNNIHDGDASSGSGGRIRRRKLGLSSSTGWVSGDGSRDVSGRSSPELEFVMEMDV